MKEKSNFTIYPAIDLREGQVVRLLQGDPGKKTVYGNSPASAAQNWIERGASWLHVVNLDGAFGEKGEANLRALAEILELTQRQTPIVNVQFGGGLRSLSDVEKALQAGVSRVMLGSLAVEAPEIIQAALEQYEAERIGLAMDVRDGKVRTRGWMEETQLDPVRVGAQFYQMGLRICTYTEISRDGGGTGIDIQGTTRFAEGTRLDVIASGGVGSLDDVQRVKQARLSGVIIGRALYDGKIKLEEALQC